MSVNFRDKFTGVNGSGCIYNSAIRQWGDSFLVYIVVMIHGQRQSVSAEGAVARVRHNGSQICDPRSSSISLPSSTSLDR